MNANYSGMLQMALVVVIQVLLPVLLGFLVVWLKKQTDLVKSKIPGEQLAFASELARQLVQAAEQTGLTGAISAEGSAKKEWVISQMEVELAKKGVKLDLHIISSLIENAVYEAFTQFKDPTLAPQG
jgi:hypothetical protein